MAQKDSRQPARHTQTLMPLRCSTDLRKALFHNLSKANTHGEIRLAKKRVFLSQFRYSN
jgi:hypothetical protein